jgi:hypothetical protein
MTENRDRTGRFVKGESGNPRGRTPISKDVKEMLKASSLDAARLLVETINNPQAKPELRVRCAETVLDRVYGKAVQPLDGTATDNRIQISLDDAARELMG